MNQSGITLIGINGHAQAGKDTVAKYVTEYHLDAYRESFADSLKECAAKAFNIPLHFFHDTELKEQPHPFWKVSPREIVQFMGTEMFRETISKLLPDVGPNFWVNRMHGRIFGELLTDDDGIYTPGDTVVIPDVRFQNEYDWIVRNGGIIIHVVRPGATGAVGIPNHKSEAGISFTNPEVTYRLANDSSIGDLYNKVDIIVQEANIKLISKGIRKYHV